MQDLPLGLDPPTILMHGGLDRGAQERGAVGAGDMGRTGFSPESIGWDLLGAASDAGDTQINYTLGASPACSPRIAAVVRGAARGFQALRVELWLLDDETRRLRLAESWPGGPAESFAPTQRMLADSPADLAAIAGEAVALEDRGTLRAWQVAGPQHASACVPVASDTTIHGSLWVNWTQAQPISDGTLELIEIVAGRIALELERANPAS